jgi:ferrous-iron efflux pump FieF
MSSIEERGDLRRLAWRAGVVAAATAGVLAIAKLTAGVLGHSAAVTASALDSAIDLVASATNALAIHFAGAKADREHPYGHGKIEALATSLQGLLIVGTAIYLVYRGIARVVSPEPLRLLGLTLGVMGAVTVVNVALVVYMRRTARRAGSSALMADSVHYSTDIGQNLAVLLGLGAAALFGLHRLDGVLTLFVAALVIHAGIAVLRPAINELIDVRGDRDQIEALEAELTALRERGLIDAHHGLRTRVSGRTLFVEVHIELSGDMILRRAHRIGDTVRDALVARVPEAEVLVHIDVEHDEES